MPLTCTRGWLFPIMYVPSARARSQTNRIGQSGLQLSDKLGPSGVVAGEHVCTLHLGIAEVVACLIFECLPWHEGNFGFSMVHAVIDRTAAVLIR